MEKQLYTKFGGVLISFTEVMNLQSFDFDASDFIPTNSQWSSFHITVNFMENELSTKFYGVFHHFLKLQSFEWLNFVSKLVTSSTRMNVRNMLIVAYMQNFVNFG